MPKQTITGAWLSNPPIYAKFSTWSYGIQKERLVYICSLYNTTAFTWTLASPRRLFNTWVRMGKSATYLVRSGRKASNLDFQMSATPQVDNTVIAAWRGQALSQRVVANRPNVATAVFVQLCLEVTAWQLNLHDSVLFKFTYLMLHPKNYSFNTVE